MEDNKRRFTRIVIKMAATLELAEGRIFQTEQVQNLSVGGCLFPVNEMVSEGETCKLTIILAEWKPQKIEVEGTVIRWEENLAAIQFESIDPDSLYHLQNLIRYNAEEPETIEEEISKRPGLI